MKRSEENSSANFLCFKVEVGACCFVSRHSVSLGQNSSSNPKTWGVRDTLKCELAKKEVQTLDVVLLRESRVYTQMRGVYTQTKYGYWKTESYEWFRQFGRSVSLRRLPRETESMCKRSFTPSNVDSRRKGSSGKGMKGGCKEAHKTTTRKVHFVALMDIREFKSTCTLSRSVGKKSMISSREK